MEAPKHIKGMSKAEDLIATWNKFKSDKEPRLIVSWMFKNPEFAINSNTPTVYIMNLRSLYNSNVPGHWIAMIKVDSKDLKNEYSKIYYYDPFGTILPKRGVDKLKCRFILENVVKDQNFKGDNSDSCGYYCILWLLSWLRNKRVDSKYQYVLFDKKYNKFTDTTPNDKLIKMNINAMKTELINNSLTEKNK